MLFVCKFCDVNAYTLHLGHLMSIYAFLIISFYLFHAVWSILNHFDAQISTAVHYILRVSSFATKAELARFVSQGASDPDAFAGRL